MKFKNTVIIIFFTFLFNLGCVEAAVPSIKIDGGLSSDKNT